MSDPKPDHPFGRQPNPVKVTIDGDTIDVDYWIGRIKRMAENQGDDVQMHHGNIFTIYPRAVNE